MHAHIEAEGTLDVRLKGLSEGSVGLTSGCVPVLPTAGLLSGGEQGGADERVPTCEWHQCVAVEATVRHCVAQGVALYGHSSQDLLDATGSDTY